MMNVNEQLRKVRKYMGMSQECVANKMDLHRASIAAIELGNRKITVEELHKFSLLYGISVEQLMYGEKYNSETNDVKMFARNFATLSEYDKKEILNIMEFKKRYKEGN